jgi:hypothetical protein
MSEFAKFSHYFHCAPNEQYKIDTFQIIAAHSIRRANHITNQCPQNACAWAEQKGKAGLIMKL